MAQHWQLDAFMAASSRDWAVLLHPSGRGYREELTGGIKNEEWAQAHYGEMVTDGMQLMDNCAQSYRLGQLKGYEYSIRYPMESEFSKAHVGSGIDFDPAVWKPSEPQKLLIDMGLHS